MIHNNSSVVELNKNAIANNVEFIKKQIGDSVKLSCVVKANAYGHSIEKMVPELESLALSKRERFIKLPIKSLP